MAEIESSAETARPWPFPPAWGTPPGAPFSEERARWVADNVERAGANRARLRLLDLLAKRDPGGDQSPERDVVA